MGRVLYDTIRLFFDCIIHFPDLGSSRHNDSKADGHGGYTTTSARAISTRYDRATDSRGYRPDESRIGYGGSPTIPLVNGEYVGTVTVKFTAQPRREPEKAIRYEAWLLLQGPPG